MKRFLLSICLSLSLLQGEIIDSLQENQVVMMGLTTQGLALATRTAVQLKSRSIDLTKTAPTHDDHFFINGPTGVLFRKGILFTSGTANRKQNPIKKV